MPAQITGLIPQQGFQKALDQIGAIIWLELSNQKTLPNTTITEDFSVWKERLIPFDAAELVSINVHCDSAVYSQMTQQSATGKVIFQIDVDTAGAEKASAPKGLDSCLRLQKYIGAIAYIFRAPYYRNLGLQGVCGGVYVQQFNLLEGNRKEDSEYTTFGRLLIECNIYEGTETTQGIPLLINNTQVFLDNTEKGFKFVFEEPSN